MQSDNIVACLHKNNNDVLRVTLCATSHSILQLRSGKAQICLQARGAPTSSATLYRREMEGMAPFANVERHKNACRNEEVNARMKTRS